MDKLFESTYNRILDAAGNRRDQVMSQMTDVEIVPDPVVEEESDAAAAAGGSEAAQAEGATGEQNAQTEGSLPPEAA